MKNICTKICFGLFVSAFALTSCKSAEFSGANKRKLGADVVRNGGPTADANPGKPGVDGPDGPGKPGIDGPNGPGVDGPGGPGKPPITNDTGKPNAPVIETENGPATGPLSEVSILGLRSDSNDMPVMLHFKKRDGTWGEVAWPRKGQTAKIPGVCNSKKDARLEIKTTLRGQTFLPTNGKCFVGKQESPTSVTMGFEHDCNSTDYNKIDDAIAKISCPDKGIVIESLRLDPSIDMKQWID